MKKCHCVKDGNALNSMNCPIHGSIKAWALTMKDDDEFFIPDFSVVGKFEGVLQIHTYKKDAVALAKKLGKEWQVTKVFIRK